MAKKQKETVPAPAIDLKPKTPYVFLSHDTRDAEIALAFSNLLSDVTAGLLKCFMSSDKRGGQGIEYGVEWFPELMKNLHEASDVVCLLTENSVNRPWILFEAGVAKGKLDTPILGLALGVPLTTAGAGPFAQFQNSDDQEDSLVKLVIQLVRKIPGAEPKESVVRLQVGEFKTKVAEILKKKPEKPKEYKSEKQEAAAVAKLFEEIKVMFNDLPKRGDLKRIAMRNGLSKRVSPMVIEEMIHLGRKGSPTTGFLIGLSIVRENAPWLHDFGYELINVARQGKIEQFAQVLEQFHYLTDMTFRGPLNRGFFLDEEENHRLGPIAGILHQTADDLHYLLPKQKK